MSNCHCNTGITADGSGQLGRYLAALDPSYAPIDGRSTEDLLLFAKRYAGQIRFYDIPGSHIDDGIQPGRVSWREFFRRDMSVIAASVAVLDIAAMKTEYDELRERIDQAPTQEKYRALFSIIIGMAVRMDRWYTVAIPENPLRTDLDLDINSHLRWQMKRIMAYEDGYKYIDTKNPLNIDYSGIENDAVWGLKDPVNPDTSIYEGGTLEDKIRNAALYADELFYDFYSTLQRYIDKGPGYVKFAMEQYPAHQPHMALFIAFLQLFSLAQQQMNGLTGRMLDFYYKEVLQLQPKDAIPDKAHVVFELAKDIVQYALPAGTAVSAGKDASGKEQVYKTGTDMVVSQAKVKELKTIFIEKIPDASRPGKSTISRIYARPVANSADGWGEAFTDPNPKWPTFGKGEPADIKSANICKQLDALQENILTPPPVQTGFAIASPQLVLQGGNRIIGLRLQTEQELPQVDAEVWLTGEKGWLKITAQLSNAAGSKIAGLFVNGGDLSTAMPEESSYYFDGQNKTLYVCLPISEAPIIAYDAAVHTGSSYITAFPVMQVMLGPVLDIDSDVYNSLSIDKTELAVRVGSDNPVTPDDLIMVNGTISSLGQFLPEVQVNVYPPRKNLKGTSSGGHGEYNLLAPMGSFLVFRRSGFKTKAVQVTGNVLNVELTRGDGVEGFDFSIFRLTAYYDGLKQLTVLNDDGVVNPDKPFDPFTAYPKEGNSLYIGSNEVFNKPLNSLTVHIRHLNEDMDQWLDIGEDIFADNENAARFFEIYSASVLYRRQWQQLCSPDGNDFTEGQLSQNMLFRKKADGSAEPLTGLRRTPLLYDPELTSTTEKGFIQLTNKISLTRNVTAGVKGDAVLMKRSTPSAAAGSAFANGTTDVFQQMALLAAALKIKELSVSYYTRLSALEPGIDQFFHVYPFGVVETYSGTAGKTVAVQSPAGESKTAAAVPAGAAAGSMLVNADGLLLPQYTFSDSFSGFNLGGTAGGKALPVKGVVKQPAAAYKAGILNRLMAGTSSIAGNFTGGNNQYTGNIQEEGMLFIGIEKAAPLQTLSLLFQFAEGSAQDEDNDPPVLHWSYLTNNEWRPMRQEDVVSDGTWGFQTTGIVKLNIPADATSNNTIITSGLHWICISVTENSHRIPQLINVLTQAVEVVFADNGNAPAHFDAALPAGSITKLSVKVAEVSKVEQPFASYDGKHAEISGEFYTRVSERLRHKNRAINSWDYEHLVLDRFPSVYKVKCITATDPNCLCRDTVVAAPVPEAEVAQTVRFKIELEQRTYDPTPKGMEELNKVFKLMEDNATATALVTFYPADKKELERAQQMVADTPEAFAENGVSNAAKRVTAKIETKGGVLHIVDVEVTIAGGAGSGQAASRKFSVAFDPATLKPTVETAALMAKITTLMRSKKGATLEITAHGSSKFDIARSMRLAAASKQQLVSKGVPAASITIETGKAGLAHVLDMEITLPGGTVKPPAPVPAARTICCGPQVAPGHVLVVPIPNLKNRNSINPLQPKTSRRTLLEIEAYLKKLTSPFVKVHAKNPVYEQIIVGFRVQFYTGTDKGFYLKKLNEEIVHYLTPWAFDETADVEFGRKIYASSIINFIEERPYVDFITDFVMGVCKDGCCSDKPGANVEQAYPAAEQRYLAERKEAVKTKMLQETRGAVKKAAGAIAKINGVVFDAKTGDPLPGATVSIKETGAKAVTGADGMFFIEGDPATAILEVAYTGYKAIQVPANGDTEFKIGLTAVQLEEVIVVGYDTNNDEDSMESTLARLCGCSDIEELLEEMYYGKNGEIAATPSTPRSILVSVPQHLIIPYVAPEKKSPCEERRAKKVEPKVKDEIVPPPPPPRDEKPPVSAGDLKPRPGGGVKPVPEDEKGKELKPAEEKPGGKLKGRIDILKDKLEGPAVKKGDLLTPKSDTDSGKTAPFLKDKPVADEKITELKTGEGIKVLPGLEKDREDVIGVKKDADAADTPGLQKIKIPPVLKQRSGEILKTGEEKADDVVKADAEPVLKTEETAEKKATDVATPGDTIVTPPVVKEEAGETVKPEAGTVKEKPDDAGIVKDDVVTKIPGLTAGTDGKKETPAAGEGGITSGSVKTPGTIKVNPELKTGEKPGIKVADVLKGSGKLFGKVITPGGLLTRGTPGKGAAPKKGAAPAKAAVPAKKAAAPAKKAAAPAKKAAAPAKKSTGGKGGTNKK